MPWPGPRVEMPRRAHTAFALPACLLTLISLSACTGLDSAGASSDPQAVHSRAAALGGDDRAADGSGADGGLSVVDPGWDGAAQECGGVFVAPHEAGSDVECRGVDAAGRLLGAATRPRVCSGCLVSDSEDGPVAVLMDQQSDGNATLDATASGFDLASGEKLWGPVEVPGPLLGSGLGFAGPPEDFIGAGGPRTAL